MKLFNIILKIKVPSDEAKNLNFVEKSSDIFEATDAFNDKFRDWNKRIIIVQLAKRTIQLLLIKENDNDNVKLTAREIRVFTSHLSHNNNWNKYSKESSKMFECTLFKHLNITESKQLLAKVISNKEYYKIQKQDVDFVKDSINTSTSEVDIPADYTEMEDHEALAIINYLIHTKNSGLKSKEKQNVISEIKKILSTWI
jgi:hypothetical protein